LPVASCLSPVSCFLLLAFAAPAAAAPSARAAFTLSITPRALHADAGTYRALLAPCPEAAALVEKARAALGLDLLSGSGFARTGLVADRPVRLSAFAIERAEVDAAYRSAMQALARRDWRGLRQPPPAWYRHRLVARVADPVRLGAFLAEQTLTPLGTVSGPAVQRAVGLDRKAAATLAGKLRAAGAVGLGRLPGDGLALARLVGPDLIVDVAQPWLAASPPPAQQGALLLELCAGEAPAAPATGAHRLLEQGGAITLAVDGGRLQDLALIAGRERALALMPRLAPAARLAALAAADAQAQTCREGLAAAAAAATLTDAAVALDLVGGALEARVAFGLAPGRAAAFTTHDDRLPPLPARSDALATIALRLDLAGYPARVPRGGPLARRLGEATRFVADCGPLAELLAMVRYWPELLALAVEEARHERDAGGILAGMHGLVLALRDFTREPRAFALAALEPAAARTLARLVEAGRTPVRLAQERRADGRVLVLAATDAESLARARALGAARAPAGTARAPIELDLDLARFLDEHAGAPEASGTRASSVSVRALAPRVGRLRGALAVTGDTLAGRLRLELR
jgi:hypothetical protein